MKKFLHCAASVLILMAASACGSFSNRGTVERPMIGSANTRNMSFEKIELTDSSTVLHGVIHFRPGYWVRLAPSSEIKVDGVSYPVSVVDGITLGEQVVMPDSGVVRFSMTFPSIPEKAKSLDFSEGVDGGWAIWNVDLTGEATHDMNHRDVPKAALKSDRTVPEEMLAFGDSTVIYLHILGYKPEMGSRLMWVANTLHGQVGDLPDAEVDSLGNAVVKISLSAPAEIMPIQFDGGLDVGGSFFVAPGETLNAYLDTHTSGIWNMEVRDGEETFEYPADYERTFTDGIYPILRRKIGMNLYSGSFGDYHMNGDEYTAYILDQYKALVDTVDAMPSLTDVGRRYNKAMLAGDLISAATDAQGWLIRNYRAIHGWRSPIPADSINCVLSPENVKAIAEAIDLSDPWLMLSSELGGRRANTKFWEDAGVDPGMIKTMDNYNRAYAAADNGALDVDAFDEMKLPAPMAEEIKARNAIMKARMEELNAASLVTPTPAVAADKVFDAIVAPHKGKVVVVDLWNTWCGPCRAAIKANEPEKSGDLADDDIVWIYIANQTSPRAKYLQMISDIKGIHYQLENEQWRAICDRFSVDGIPYYIIVDRNGKAEGSPDLRDHSLYKKTILEKLAR